MELSIQDREKILDDVYSWSSGYEFKGYNKHDGLNSPLLAFFLGKTKWTRIIAIQTVMRSPINIRPLLLVPKTVNPKGLALFILGLLDRYGTDQSEQYLEEARRLGEMLLEIRSAGPYSGDCWGYPYPWQDLGFFAQSHTPNAVVTSFVCEAFLELFRVTGDDKYLISVGRAIDFFLKDLVVLEDTSDMLCLSYMPMRMSMRVMDVSILIGAVIAQYARLINDSEKMEVATLLVAYVVAKQTDYHAWFYTDPPEDSFIRHDNYHTGFILDALWRYMKANDDWQWKNNYSAGLDFYAKKLFTLEGAPKWMSDKTYPFDVHGSAQGLASFSLAVANGYQYQSLLDHIGCWAINNLYKSEGRFIYRKGKLVNYNYTLLRWCNAWMFRGMSAWNNCPCSEDK